MNTLAVKLEERGFRSTFMWMWIFIFPQHPGESITLWKQYDGLELEQPDSCP